MEEKVLHDSMPLDVGFNFFGIVNFWPRTSVMGLSFCRVAEVSWAKELNWLTTLGGMESAWF